MRPPKSLERFEPAALAAAKLIKLALEQILLLKPGYVVRWKLEVSLWNPDWADKEKLARFGKPCVAVRGSYSNK